MNLLRTRPTTRAMVMLMAAGSHGSSLTIVYSVLGADAIGTVGGGGARSYGATFALPTSKEVVVFLIAPIRPLCLALVAASTIAVVGCATKSQTGAVVGAAGGAVVGGAIGAAAGSTAKGAIIGAVVGGVAGAIIGAEMDKQAKELEQNIKGAKVERVGEGIQVTFDSGLLYDFDSDQVRPEAKTNLSELARSLDKYPGSDLLIVGHTDPLGSESYNQGLSERRASAAANYLASQGIVRSRVSTRGLGETEPIAPNDTEAGRAKNRRVEVAIYASEQYRAEVIRRSRKD